jgi:hypothetical protein
MDDRVQLRREETELCRWNHHLDVIEKRHFSIFEFILPLGLRKRNLKVIHRWADVWKLTRSPVQVDVRHTTHIYSIGNKDCGGEHVR